MLQEINTNDLPLPTVPGRECGACSMCCKVIPVAEIAKPRDVWCVHAAKHLGCEIYADRPKSCRRWTCGWLSWPAMPTELKPNISHVVFDTMPDVLRLGGKPFKVMQIWVDLGYPEAHRAPAVRNFIEKIAGEYRFGAIVRVGNKGIALFPPSLTGAGWIEREARLDDTFVYGGKEHTDAMADPE